MPFRKLKPTSPGTRFQTVPTFDEITTQEPHKPLMEPIRSTGGRNNQGHLTSWWRGGGHKRMYRIIDFRRDKRDIPAKVATAEYDPNRSARIALLTYAERFGSYSIVETFAGMSNLFRLKSMIRYIRL